MIIFLKLVSRSIYMSFVSLNIVYQDPWVFILWPDSKEREVPGASQANLVPRS